MSQLEYKIENGDEPSSIDASISAMLNNIIIPDIDSQLKKSTISFKKSC